MWGSGLRPQLHGKSGITPDPTDRCILAADGRADIKIGCSLKHLRGRVTSDVVGFVKTCPAIADVSAPIVILWDADGYVPVRVGPDITGMSRVVMQMHIGTEAGLDGDGFPTVRDIVVQANEQIRLGEALIDYELKVLPAELRGAVGEVFVNPDEGVQLVLEPVASRIS